jgi:hypothetical protein
MKEDRAGQVHWKLYGKSDKLNATENKNEEFRAGYWRAVESLGYNAHDVITEEHALRAEIGDDLGSNFQEWVRGFWAARSQLVAARIKKQRRHGKFLGEKSDEI